MTCGSGESDSGKLRNLENLIVNSYKYFTRNESN